MIHLNKWAFLLWTLPVKISKLSYLILKFYAGAFCSLTLGVKLADKLYDWVKGKPLFVHGYWTTYHSHDIIQYINSINVYWNVFFLGSSRGVRECLQEVSCVPTAPRCCVKHFMYITSLDTCNRSLKVGTIRNLCIECELRSLYAVQ